MMLGLLCPVPQSLTAGTNGCVLKFVIQLAVMFIYGVLQALGRVLNLLLCVADGISHLVVVALIELLRHVGLPLRIDSMPAIRSPRPDSSSGSFLELPNLAKCVLASGLDCRFCTVPLHFHALSNVSHCFVQVVQKLRCSRRIEAGCSLLRAELFQLFRRRLQPVLEGLCIFRPGACHQVLDRVPIAGLADDVLRRGPAKGVQGVPRSRSCPSFLLLQVGDRAQAGLTSRYAGIVRRLRRQQGATKRGARSCSHLAPLALFSMTL